MRKLSFIVILCTIALDAAPLLAQPIFVVKQIDSLSQEKNDGEIEADIALLGTPVGRESLGITLPDSFFDQDNQVESLYLMYKGYLGVVTPKVDCINLTAFFLESEDGLGIVPNSTRMPDRIDGLAEGQVEIFDIQSGRKIRQGRMKAGNVLLGYYVAETKAVTLFFDHVEFEWKD